MAACTLYINSRTKFETKNSVLDNHYLMKTKILFFIGGLSSGGKERRLLELMTYLHQSGDYHMVLVTQREDLDFDIFNKLKVDWIVLSTGKLKVKSFGEFFNIVRKHRPHIIHTWGSKQTLVSLPSRVFLSGIKLVNSQITSAPPFIAFSERVISQANFIFSDIILSNSYAGIEAFNPPKRKAQVIYNGLNKNRFVQLPQKKAVRDAFSLNKPYTLIMVASFSANKDYQRFYQVGIALSQLRKDFNFVGVGYYDSKDDSYYQDALAITKAYPHLKLIPGSSEVEALINASDIGLLFSPNGEGLSNAILEYMALGKPVIANDAGGTREIVRNGENGYLIREESPEQIAVLINRLLDNPEKMKEMGEKSRLRIEAYFSLDNMGRAFEKVYQSLISIPK